MWRRIASPADAEAVSMATAVLLAGWLAAGAASLLPHGESVGGGGRGGCRHSVTVATWHNRSSRAERVCVCVCVCVARRWNMIQPPSAVRSKSDSCRYRPSLPAPFITAAQIKCLGLLSWYQCVSPKRLPVRSARSAAFAQTADLHSSLFIVDSRRLPLQPATLPMTLEGGSALVYHPPLMHY